MSLDPRRVAEQFREYLQRADAQFVALCASDAIVHATSLDYDATPNRLVQHGIERLAALRAANHTALPDIGYAVDNITSEGDTIRFTWTATGTQRGALAWVAATGRQLTMSGTCRLATERDKVTEIWLDFDVYDLLEQMGRICARPGEASGGALAVNRAAMEQVRRAIVERAATIPALDGLYVRASIRTYMQDFTTRAFRFAGNELPGVLARIAELFPKVDVVVDDGVSQGATTTFRGALVASGRFHHLFRCGFESPADRPVQCWLEVMPPPTIKEYMR